MKSSYFLQYFFTLHPPSSTWSSKGDLGHDSVFFCGYVAGRGSIPSVLLVELCTRAKAAQVQRRGVNEFEIGSISGSTDLNLHKPTQNHSSPGA
jgi:hypothetical protein